MFMLLRKVFNCSFNHCFKIQHLIHTEKNQLPVWLDDKFVSVFWGDLPGKEIIIKLYSNEGNSKCSWQILNGFVSLWSRGRRVWTLIGYRHINTAFLSHLNFVKNKNKNKNNNALNTFLLMAILAIVNIFWKKN